MHLEDRGVGAKLGHIFYTFICSSNGLSSFVIRIVLKRDNLGKWFIKKGHINRRFAPRSRARCELVASLLAAGFATAVPAAIYLFIDWVILFWYKNCIERGQPGQQGFVKRGALI